MLDRFSGLHLIVRLGIAVLAGAFGALGQAPFDIPVALLLSLTAAFWMWRAEATHPGLLGWAFGIGYFAIALVWIVEPFQVDALQHGWMAPFALVFLSSGLALFWAGAFWAARKLSHRSLGLVFAWTGAELLRAYAFTGFPWASPAQIVLDGPASVLLAWGGPHLTTLVLLTLAWVLSCPASPPRVASMRLGQLLLLIAGALALSIPHARAPAELKDQVVRLVQPNAAQHLKWRPDMAEEFFKRQLSLTEAEPTNTDRAPTLVVWPETAIPWRLGGAGPALQQIAASASGTPVALGALRFEEDYLRNSLAVVAPDGRISAIYDKHHLVPFGEYVPFGPLAEKLGLQAIAASIGGFSNGPGPVLLDFGPLGKALPLICYEAVFAHGVNAMPARADFLLQITNDAWFGTYAGPQQHLAQARMRAIEQGLPLVRAANTGISAMIGPTGRILAHLPLGEAGFLDARLPAPLSPTLYSKTGDWPTLIGVLIGLACSFGLSSRARRRVSD